MCVYRSRSIPPASSGSDTNIISMIEINTCLTFKISRKRVWQIIRMKTYRWVFTWPWWAGVALMGSSFLVLGWVRIDRMRQDLARGMRSKSVPSYGPKLRRSHSFRWHLPVNVNDLTASASQGSWFGQAFTIYTMERLSVYRRWKIHMGNNKMKNHPNRNPNSVGIDDAFIIQHSPQTPL